MKRYNVKQVGLNYTSNLFKLLELLSLLNPIQNLITLLCYVTRVHKTVPVRTLFL